MARLVDLLFGRVSKFYEFERSILENVKSRLDAKAGLLFQRQVDAINKVQRLAEGREVNFYQIADGRSAFDKSLCFQDMPDEVMLATVELALDSNQARLKVEVWLVGGRLFSLEFSKPPRQFFGGVSMDNAQIIFCDVTIWLDSLKLH